MHSGDCSGLFCALGNEHSLFVLDPRKQCSLSWARYFSGASTEAEEQGKCLENGASPHLGSCPVMLNTLRRGGVNTLRRGGVNTLRRGDVNVEKPNLWS